MHRDTFLQAITKSRYRILRTAVAFPLIYVGSYFLLGTHDSGFTDVAAKRWYHDRSFSFDPWIYQPIAFVEQRLRGRNTRVVLDGSPARDGSVVYGFGP